jgi:hypothetical protein
MQSRLSDPEDMTPDLSVLGNYRSWGQWEQKVDDGARERGQ